MNNYYWIDAECGRHCNTPLDQLVLFWRFCFSCVLVAAAGKKSSERGAENVAVRRRRQVRFLYQNLWRFGFLIPKSR
jgi:hypothetical protein